MTANAEIEVSRKAGVLRIPNSALRFKPAEDATASATDSSHGHGGSGMTDALPPLAQALSLDAAQRSAFDSAITSLRTSTAAHRKPPASSSTPSNGPSLFGGRGSGSRNGGNSDGGQANQGATRQRMLTRMSQQFAAFRATLTPSQQQRWDNSLATLASERQRIGKRRNADGIRQHGARGTPATGTIGTGIRRPDGTRIASPK